MRFLSYFAIAFLLLSLTVSEARGYHVPPWDTGHNSFDPDPGDNNNDPGDNSPCKSGSPVELYSGNFVHSVRDLLVQGVGPSLEIIRTYNSQDLRSGPFGNGWIYPYDQRLIETSNEVQVLAICSQPNGKREIFTKQLNGDYLAPPHVYSSLIKNNDGTYILRDKYGITRLFNSEGRLTAISDRNNNTLSFAYDGTGFPLSIIDASGRAIKFTKSATGKIESMSDPAGRVFRYLYDSAGNLIRVTDPLNQSITYQYTAKNKLTAIIDPRSNKLMEIAYDAQGRVGTLTDGAETWTYNYLIGPRRTTRRDSSNRTWTFFYNDTGNITRVVDPLSKDENYKYDSNLNLVEFLDKNGNKSSFTYDSAGNPLTSTDAQGNTKAITYESKFNRPLTSRDRTGNVTKYEYDAQGNLIKTIDALGLVTQFQYDSKGQLTRVVDPSGSSYTFTYDINGNLRGTTDPQNNNSTAIFNILGQVITSTDAEGRMSHYEYDSNQRLTKTVNPQGGVTSNEYDSSGNIIAVTQPNGARTTFDYDSLNRLTRITNPLNQNTTYTYDRKGNLLSKTDPKGQQTRYLYDSLDRLIQKVKPSDTTTYSYDSAGNLLTVVDGDSNLTFIHDALHRVVEARTAQTSGQPSTSIRYTYDAEGHRLTMTDPGGGVTNYNYDADFRLVSLTDPARRLFTFAYDNKSRRTQTTRGNAITTSYGYDTADRLTSLVHQSGAGALNQTYTYDRVGNRQSLIDSAGTHTFSYDSLHRLTRAARPGTTESYSYDSAGNRTSSHLSASYSYNSANRLTADAEFDYLYDLNGNLTRKTERATGKAYGYAYDAENQLTQVTTPTGGNISFRYDGLGRRIEKNANGQITRYVYDGQDVLFEYAGTTLQARYTHGPGVDELLSVQRAGQTSFFETDALGSVVRVTDGSTVKATYAYDAFGRILQQTGASQAPYLFQGREYDPETGLYYFRARYYDPGLGRFLNEDPISFAGGANFYRFALNNPMKYLDPFGLRPCLDDWLDSLQTLLDLAGLIPGFGEFFDLANAGIYGLRGDSLNAGLSLASAVPFLGWAGTASKLGNKAVKSGVKEGIYEFVSTSGKKYVGQSGDIDKRLIQHIKNGKVTAEEAARAARSEVLGGKTAREIAEQRRIDQLGGIQNLENKVNPIGPNRRHLLDQ